MEEHLYTLLDVALSCPVSWGHAEAVTSLPRVVLHRVSGSNEPSLDGPGIMSYRVQVDTFARTYAEAITISRTVQSTLDGYSGGAVQGSFLDSVRDGIEGDAGLAHRISLSFTVWAK